MVTKVKEKERKTVKDEQLSSELMSYDRWVTVSKEQAEKMVEAENARLLAEGKKAVKKLYRFTLGSKIESRGGELKATIQYETGSAHVLWCAANNNYHADWLFNAHLGHQASSKEDVSVRNIENDAMALDLDERMALAKKILASCK